MQDRRWRTRPRRASREISARRGRLPVVRNRLAHHPCRTAARVRAGRRCLRAPMRFSAWTGPHARPARCLARRHRFRTSRATSRVRSPPTMPTLRHRWHPLHGAHAGVCDVLRCRWPPRHGAPSCSMTQSARQEDPDEKCPWLKPCMPWADPRGNPTIVDRLHSYESTLWISCTSANRRCG